MNEVQWLTFMDELIARPGFEWDPMEKVMKTFAIRRAFTLVELLVVIGIIALLISILLPTLSRAREAGNRIACASNMRQLGMAFEMYLTDSKGTYPPAWFEDDYKTAGPSYAGQAGFNITWATLLRKYVRSGSAARNENPRVGGDLPVFKCPNDKLERASWLGGGALSYTMPASWGPDGIFNAQRVVPAFQGIPNGWLNRGVGQRFDSAQSYPLWVKRNMLKPAGEVLLLVERCYSEQAQTVVWNIGYQVSNPSQQRWLNGNNGIYGFPMLHAGKGQEKQSSFNYLCADYHVQLMSSKDTIRDATTLVAGAVEGGDYMWTIRPYQFKN